MLTRLIYHSTFLAGADGMTDVELERILSASRRNNPKRGITGLLLHDARGFVQILEGPRPAVSATFLRIASDPRHYGVVLNDCRATEARLFPRWAMAFAKARPEVQNTVLDWAGDRLATDAALAKAIAPTGLNYGQAA